MSLYLKIQVLQIYVFEILSNAYRRYYFITVIITVIIMWYI